MNITWLGESCFKIEVKLGNEDIVILTDPFDSEKTGLKLPRALPADIVLQSAEKLPVQIETREGKKPFFVAGPGEYEVKGVFIYAIPFVNPQGATEHLFWIEAEHIVLLYTGNLSRVLTETELQKIEGVDVLMIPVGGAPFDAKRAAELVSELEPRVVIPMRYKIAGLKTKADAVEPFLKMLGAKVEQLPKLKISRKDLPTDDMKVVVLEKT